MSKIPDTQGEPRHRVLLVDDDPAMLRSMTALLSAHMDVVTCMSGQQALTLLSHRPFDVVCSDYRMPGMNGVEVLRAASQAQEDASCLLVTASPDEVPPADRRRYFVVVKPFDAERLVRLVDQLARVSRMKRSVKAPASKPPVSGPRDSRPPPSSRHGAQLSERPAPISERRPAPISVPRSPLPPPTNPPPRSTGGGNRK